jgi:2-haloacid dehalogenase
LRACVFDAYGTLFDVHSAVARHAAAIGAAADPLSRLWRQKQLEYSWVRSLIGRHVDFWTVTVEALDFALRSHAIDDPTLRQELLEAYLALDTYPEVPDVLRRLRADGVRVAILSNGSPAMLEAAVRSAGIETLVDLVLSIEDIGVYKPDPRVYRYASDRLELAPERMWFGSSNAWDAAGAASFGCRVAWINRGRQPAEYGWALQPVELQDLSRLPEIVARGMATTAKED